MKRRFFTEADMAAAKRDEARMNASAKSAKRKVKSFRHEDFGGIIEVVEIPPTNEPLRRSALKGSTPKKLAITRVPMSERNRFLHPY